MKKKLLLIISFLVILFSLFQLSSCRQDIIETDKRKVQNSPLSYIRNEYIKDKNILFGKEIEWNGAKLYKKSYSIVFITVPIKNIQTNVIEVLSFRIDEGEVLGHLWKYESIKAFAPEDYKLSGHQIMNRMTGKVSYTSLDGRFSYNLKMIAGTSIQDTRISSLDNIMALGSDTFCAGKCHRDIEGVEIPGNPGTRPGKDPNPYPDTSPVPPAIMPGSGPISPVKPDKIEDEGIKNNKCAYGVYQTLRSKPGLFNILLDKFDGKTILNLDFQLKSMGKAKSTEPAYTDPSRIYNYGQITINFNSDILGSPDLFIASLFIHEMLHAKIMHELVKAGWNGNQFKDLARIDKVNLPTILGEYYKYKFQNNTADHNYIANWYVEKIANALASFDTNKQSMDYYKKMAWGPLSESDAWNRLPEDYKNAVSKLYYENLKPLPCGK
ncbi:hypothetical protein CMU93_07040 [Elizabethkingia anophelis]|nr:hypothetical protein [Elizabethkingia anophelis]